MCVRYLTNRFAIIKHWHLSISSSSIQHESGHLPNLHCIFFVLLLILCFLRPTRFAGQIYRSIAARALGNDGGRRRTTTEATGGHRIVEDDRALALGLAPRRPAACKSRARGGCSEGEDGGGPAKERPPCVCVCDACSEKKKSHKHTHTHAKRRRRRRASRANSPFCFFFAFNASAYANVCRTNTV